MTIYKTAPVKGAIRQLAKSASPALAATQYIGISANETRRATPARDAWLTNRSPLIDMGWKRTDCIEWLDANYPGHPVKRSACHIYGSTQHGGK